MAESIRRLYRKSSGTFYLRILVAQQGSSAGSERRQRAEVRYSLRTRDRDRAVAMAAWVNAHLRQARSMTDRKALLDAIGHNLRAWTIGPQGISAEPGEDTDALLRVLDAHPQLIPPADPTRPSRDEVRQAMADTIARRVAEDRAAKTAAGATGPTPAGNRPANPLRFSEAVRLYLDGGNFVARTVADKRRLLASLQAHLVATHPELAPDPFIHEVQTHHLSAFLDGSGKKRQTDGKATAESASPKTVLKKLSDLSAFFKWALDERQAALFDPSLGLTKRARDLKKAAVKVQRSYAPFATEQLRRIFEPKAYLAFNRKADHFWAPLLALHLGTRLKEVVTLSLEDVGCHEPTGIHFVDVTADHAKNANSIRRLPVTQQLVELGFLDYVRHVRGLGAKRLFPHVNFDSPTVRQDPSKYCSRQFAAYLDSLDMKDPDLVFHSFRHTLVSALQDANVPLADAMQITGHQAQEHAVRSGRMTTSQAQSVHLKVYAHSDKARLNVEFPIARLKSHLDAVAIDIDHDGLRQAANVVREKTVRTANGFKSG